MSDTFFATIAGAFIAFLGVVLTLRHTQRNFETNLRAEREKAREEREFLAKHKALVSAVESVTRFLNYYLTFPDRELPKDGDIPHEVTAMVISLNNLHFYCGIETIQHSINMSQVLNASFAKALKAKMSSLFVAENIKAIDRRIAWIEAINNQLHQETLALLSSDPSNPLLVSYRKQLVSNSEKIAELQREKTILMKEKYHKTEACRDVIRGDLKEIYEAVRNVLLMARRELAFPINETQYLEILNQATESSLASTNNLFDEIRTEILKKLH